MKYNTIPPSKKEKMDKVYEKKTYLTCEAICKGTPEDFSNLFT